MTRIAFKHEGTLDRIVGDAVAIMFAAPVHQPDHAQRAVLCALDIDRFAVEFSRCQRKNGLPLGDTRIGVNSGSVIVGNVGSSSHLDYRALGDAINTASRLENANRCLGTRVCVGEATRRQCPDFVGRTIGMLMLPGKDTGVQAYEPWDAAAKTLPLLQDYATAFRSLSAEAPGSLAAFESLCRAYPDDGLIAFYVERLRQGEMGSVVTVQKS